ncbi:hypothetical protein TUM12137_50070 (plasmid) [Klebsiella pneumoniae]|nr:hypothetical protein TUM12137_50070 [Klebsiella pneumoniae]BCY97156.1 hypothetical protein TUM12138_50070 [Klebsiella pneumoniae]
MLHDNLFITSDEKTVIRPDRDFLRAFQIINALMKSPTGWDLYVERASRLPIGKVDMDTDPCRIIPGVEHADTVVADHFW